MTAPPMFPALAGQGWSVHKRPTFSTRVADHASGREVRLPLYDYPLYEFEATFDALDSDGAWPSVGAQSLQSLLGLFLQCQGQFGTFVYVDPTDRAAAGQAIATGDGSTTAFVFQRALGGFIEPVSWVTSVEAVYLNGVAQASGWSLTQPNALVLATAPAAGAVISADFSYGFLCRFLADQNDFENFMNGLWTVESLKFRSVKP
jgi:hypothetical protein